MAAFDGPGLRVPYSRPASISLTVFQSHGHSCLQQRLGNVAPALCWGSKRNGCAERGPLSVK